MQRPCCGANAQQQSTISHIDHATQKARTVTDSEQAVVRSAKNRPMTRPINAVTNPQAQMVATGWWSVTATAIDQLSNVKAASALLKLNRRFVCCIFRLPRDLLVNSPL